VVAIDKADSRLEKARTQFGADVTVNSAAELAGGLTGSP
jgi:threonine dehydrogenase-like Zn-dependent dehydrogenase